MRAKIDGVLYAVLFSHCHITDRAVPAPGTPTFVDKSGKTHPVWETLESTVHGGSAELREVLASNASFARQLRKSRGCTLCKIVEVTPGKPSKEGKILGTGLTFCSCSEKGYNRSKGRTESLHLAMVNAGLSRDVKQTLGFVMRSKGSQLQKAMGVVPEFTHVPKVNVVTGFTTPADAGVEIVAGTGAGAGIATATTCCGNCQH